MKIGLQMISLIARIRKRRPELLRALVREGATPEVVDGQA
jgi:hypothetical protein